MKSFHDHNDGPQHKAQINESNIENWAGFTAALLTPTDTDPNGQFYKDGKTARPAPKRDQEWAINRFIELGDAFFSTLAQYDSGHNRLWNEARRNGVA